MKSQPSVLARLQGGLEGLYRVETGLSVDEFVIDEGERDDAPVARGPREQLLVRQDGAGGLRLGLFVDGDAVRNLEKHDPAAGLSDRNFGDFCLAVEGVSHFVYIAVCAGAERAVSALELELQAEIDKFVCCLLVGARMAAAAATPADLRRRLYERVHFAEDLSTDERDRYRTANAEARRYVMALERRFLATQRLADMLAELRRFFRLDLPGKLHHIAGAA